MITAVILAAGRSQRMGSPKAFLTIEGETFVERIAGRLRGAGVKTILAVFHPELMDQARATLEPAGVRVLENADSEGAGPISSIRVALGAVDPAAWGILVCPVDHPLGCAETFAAIARAAEENPGQIIVPEHEGAPGHPALFPAEVFDDLRIAPAGRGADWVLEQHDYRVVRLAVADPGVLANIDTPEDYQTMSG